MMRLLPVWLCLLTLSATPARAQGRAESGTSLPNRSYPPPTAKDSDATKRVKNGPPTEDLIKTQTRRAQAIALQEETRRKAVEEAAQLVKLAEELRDAINAESAVILSVATLNKTKQIEKLAKSIRGHLN